MADSALEKSPRVLPAAEGLVEASPEVQNAAQVLLGVMSAVAKHPEMPAETVKVLMAEYRELEADQRRQAYDKAMIELQPLLPRIDRNGRIVDKKGGIRRYSRYEDVDTAIRPLYTEAGFAVSYSQTAINGVGGKPWFEMAITVAHRGGHRETFKKWFPLDKSDYRPDIQSMGSTDTYARRYLLLGAFNIVSKDSDDDGSGARMTPITAEQLAELERLLLELKIDPTKSSKPGGTSFLKYMGVENLKDIRGSDWQKAIGAIDARRGK